MDPDYSHNQIKYFIDQDLNQDWSFFTIDPLTGNIFTKGIFDYETKTDYTLRVIAKDTGIMIDETSHDPLDATSSDSLNSLNDNLNSYVFNLSSSLVIHIRVDDLDDNEPEFSSNYRVNDTFTRNVSDTLEKSSTIAVLPLALDRDTYEQNIRVKYYLVDGNHDNKFELNETSGELILIDELDYKVVNKYELTIRATSRYTHTEVKAMSGSENERSVIKVILNIVPDKLVIEFDEQQYYVSLQANTSQLSSEMLMHSINMRKLSTEIGSAANPNFSDVSHLSYDESYMKRMQQSDLAIFFARAHLKQRKLKRLVKFSVDMLQLIRYNEQSAVKLPSTSLVQVVDLQQAGSLDLIKSEQGHFLFSVDVNTGKIFANKRMLLKANYHVGDRFIITIAAVCQTALEINVDDENTLTHLTVRLTDKDYSFIMPINKKFKHDDIVLNYLNPLRTNYIPRVLETDGVKLSVQDLIASKLPPSEKTEDDETQAGFDLIFQVDTKQDHKQVGLPFLTNEKFNTQYFLTHKSPFFRVTFLNT